MGKLRTTKDSFIAKAREVHGDKYLYDKVVWRGVMKKVVITCKIHGDFEQQPNSHTSTGRGCDLCGGSATWTTERFAQTATKVHSGFYDYSKSVCSGAYNKLVIDCPVHGEFEQTPTAHCTLKQGCPKCAYAKIPERHAHAAKDFVEKALAVHGDNYDYSKVLYTRSRHKVEIICPVHGSFLQTPNNHLIGKGCGRCSPGGFNKEKQGYLYVLVDGDLTKVGITNKSPTQRAGVVNNLGGKSFNVLSAFCFPKGVDAITVEGQLLTYLRSKYEASKEKFNGYTECFYNVDITQLMIECCKAAIKHDIVPYDLNKHRG